MVSRARSLAGDNPEGRPEGDFYPTPDLATISLFASGYLPVLPMHEPACGDGAISKLLISVGCPVYSADLYDRGYGETGIDFLTTTERKGEVLITNPPFRLGLDFLSHAYELGYQYIFLLAKLAFLGGIERSNLLEKTNLSRVLIFRRRPTFTRNGVPMTNGGMIEFAWFCWLPDHVGHPIIEWI